MVRSLTWSRRSILNVTSAFLLGFSLIALALAQPLATIAQDGSDSVEISVQGELQATGGTGSGTGAAASAGSNLINPTTSVSTTIVLAANEWSGGYYRGDSQWYGRPWTAIYGAQSQYPSASFAINIDQTPSDKVVVILTGLNDETGVKSNISVTLNGRSLFNGPSWFNSWDGQGQGQNASWTTVTMRIPASFFTTDTNTFTVQNLRQGSNFSEPPYVLLGATEVQVPGSSASIGTPSGVDITVGN